MTRIRFTAALLATLFISSPALAVDNYNGLDSTGATITLKAKDIGSGVKEPQTLLSDALGVPFGYTAWGVAPTGSPNVPDVNAYLLSLPPGASTSALQPALNGDGGALAHITNPVALSGNSGTPTQSSISVATTSTTVLAASTATSFLKLCVALGSANGIWVRWDGAAATAAAPAEYIPPGQCDNWVKSSGFLPTSQINAISSSAVAASLIYN